MSLQHDKEGWGAPRRAPLIAAAALLGLLLIVLLVAGHAYVRDLRASTHAPLIAYPAPRLETDQTPPHQPRADFRQPPPARIAAAMRAAAAEGDALWSEGR